jgi:hypothetical protein
MKWTNVEEAVCMFHLQNCYNYPQHCICEAILDCNILEIDSFNLQDRGQDNR